MTKHQNIERIIGTRISNERLLRQALTHPSFFGNKKAGNSQFYERLEFLGDAVLSLIVADYLYNHHPRTREGKMTKLRSALVNKQALAKVFDSLGLMPFVNLNEKFLHRPLQTNKCQSLKADILEALIAVIYKEKGLIAAEKFIQKHIVALLPSVIKKKSYENPVNMLQERIVKIHKKNPRYKFMRHDVNESGDEFFEMRVYAGKKLLGAGIGETKKSASLAAAHEAMENLDTGQSIAAEPY